MLGLRTMRRVQHGTVAIQIGGTRLCTLSFNVLADVTLVFFATIYYFHVRAVPVSCLQGPRGARDLIGRLTA